MNAPNRSLTPSQLAQLEQAYAKAPGEAWRPLAEAYLMRGRHMEAMVVARRGARACPGDPAPHLMLARVYGSQRKADKARAAAADALKIAPDAPEVVALAHEHGLLAQETAAATAAAQASPAELGLPEAGAGAAPAAPVEGRGTADGDAPGQPTAEEQLRASWTEELARRYGEADAEEEPSLRRRRARRGLLRTATLAVALGLALAGIASVASSRRARADEQQRLLTEAKRLLEKDSWAGYRDGQATCERAAGLSGEAAAEAHACVAWAAAVRWAEHGEGEPLRAAALDHISRSGAGSARPRDAVLAEAWLELHAGDSRGAADLLRARTSADGSAALRAALGVALAQSGDPDGARASLLAAQQLAPGSPRIAQQLADHLRGRGGDGPQHAATLYEIVLKKLSPDHVPSLLGKARLLLDAKDGQAALATAHHVAELGDHASTRQRARALALESRALAQLGRKPEAEAKERAARELDAAAPELREPLAQARW